ncbi:uncharacterized protein LOC109853966 isoform X2 [Pseudomyrmex gracilis]|uniref:uncharacterized protein LOC109853966 isoform X2 n=1 Tax=Pseudomyrmex gracilis TaxID=219809 RepID=UPI000995A20E|nr:uncharacterized protein LOC109853966 isoform X2 [Pseudomyrmex gracilis]
MRNPALHLIGIAASPGGGEGIFGSRAEEELRRWLEARLDALGIDPVAYSRFVLSILRRPDSALSPPVEAFRLGVGTECRSCDRSKTKLLTCDNREQRQAVIQCLISAADDKYGVETLVDELCMKIRELDGKNSCNEREEQINNESKTNLELSPRDKALRYYTAFPALQSVSIKKFSQRKDRNLANKNNNKNNGISLHNTKNTNYRNKKSKMSVVNIESQSSEEKESFGFARSMERERESELRESELRDQLEELEAKIKSLQIIWGPTSNNAQNTASIWAPPNGSLSVPWLIDGPSRMLEPNANFSRSENNRNVGYNASNQQHSFESPFHIPHNNINLNEDNANNQERRVDWSFLSPGPFFPPNWRADAAGQTCSSFPKPSTGASNGSRMSLEVKVLEPDEDLLESDRTHFCPIKNGYIDGTSFAVNNSWERVMYRRSTSGMLYLMDDETPYMEYKEPTMPDFTNFTLKFRLRQGCDKSVQTEPLETFFPEEYDQLLCYTSDEDESGSLAKQDQFCYTSDEAFDQDDERKENKKDSFALNPIGWEQKTDPLHIHRRRISFA